MYLRFTSRATDAMMHLLRLILGLLAISKRSSGNDVVIGILGNSVSVDCKLPISDTLIWESSDGNVIAIHGHVVDTNSSKYVIEKQNGVRESLVIHNLTLADDKIFRCYNLKNRTLVEVTKLNIVVRPPIMNMIIPTDPVLEGMEVTFLCEADGGKPLPEITWFRKDFNGTIVPMLGRLQDTTYANGTGHRSSSLTFTVSRYMYRASLSCNVSVSVFYHEAFNGDLDVQLMPLQPEISGYDGSFDNNDVLKLACTSTGSRPTANVFWMLDGVAIGDFEFVVIPEPNGTFTVRSFLQRTLSRENNGSVLTCAVTNSVLQDRGLAAKMANVTLLASYAPNITIDETEYTAKEGSNLTLRCRIDAVPLPIPESMYWLHNGAAIDKGGYSILNKATEFSLNLENINISDAGNYTCHTSNRLGSSQSEYSTITVLYPPICASPRIQKHAARLGETVSLDCHMSGSPNDVMMTWRYRKSQTQIQTVQAIAEVTNRDHAYGSIEIEIGSELQYAIVECYGNNTEGMSKNPCVFQIVHPGSPAAPTNCFVETKNSKISMFCTAGFNGGSEQMFMLQRLVETEYETLYNNSMPDITFETHENVTIRMCSANREFPDIAMCGMPLHAYVHFSDFPLSDPVVVREANYDAYIAGGIIAFLAVVILSTIIVIFIIRKKQKDRTASNRKNASIEEILSNNMKDKSSRKGSWWRCFKTSTEDRAEREQNQQATPGVRRSEIVTDIDAEDASDRNINVVASTPCYSFKNYRIECNTSTNHPVAFSFEDELKINDSPDVLSESTGFVLSPITTRPIYTNDHHTTLGCLDDVIETHDSSANVHANAFDELTADISRVLNQESAYTKSDKGNGNWKTPPEEEITLNVDYSAGDIAEVLDKTNDSEVTVLTLNNAYDDQCTVIDGTHLSFDLDFSESILTNYTSQTYELNNRAPTAIEDKFDCITSPTFSQSQLTEDTLVSNVMYTSMDATINNQINKVEEKKASGHLNKTNSFPYRSRHKKVDSILKSQSSSNLNEEDNGDSIDTKTCTGQTPLVSHVIDDAANRVDALKSQLSNHNGDGSDTTSFTSARENDNTIDGITRCSSYSNFTDTADDTILDIDEFTLTITSEVDTESEYISVIVEEGNGVHESRINKTEGTYAMVDNSDKEIGSNLVCDDSIFCDGKDSFPSQLNDIDEFTLTISETPTEFESEEYAYAILEDSNTEMITHSEHTNEPANVANVLEDSEARSSEHKRDREHSPLRSDSFMEAISNPNKTSLKETEDSKSPLVSVGSESEVCFFNYGFEKSASTDDLSSKDSTEVEKETNDNTNGDKTEIDITAYF